MKKKEKEKTIPLFSSIHNLLAFVAYMKEFYFVLFF